MAGELPPTGLHPAHQEPSATRRQDTETVEEKGVASSLSQFPSNNNNSDHDDDAI